MIYFVQQRKYVKIGTANHPLQRLASLQTASPEKLKLLGMIPGSYQTECELQKVFSDFHYSGERFRYTGYLKFCLRAFTDPLNEVEIKDVRSLQQAGLQLHLKLKSKRFARQGKFELMSKIKSYS